MLYIGIDAGTTSVSGVIFDGDSETLVDMVSTEHHAALEGSDPDENIQDPDIIFSAVEEVWAKLLSGPGVKDRVRGACITGQVHGIVYIDRTGGAVSPLYTWQDRRARGAVPGMTTDWVTKVREETGRIVPAGYGLLTHVINMSEKKVPSGTAGISTILDYLGMRLCRKGRPVIDPTNAHSLGFYDPGRKEFLEKELSALHIDLSLLPEIVDVGTVIGRTPEGVEVYTAVGDNQAGFVGAVENPSEDILVNVGTSAQLSVFAGSSAGGMENPAGWIGPLEVRPHVRNDFIFSGASLSGGSAYSLLESLFREICRRYGGNDPGPLFGKMNEVDIQKMPESSRLRVATSFFGTRQNWEAAGSIEGIGKDNFTSKALIDGFTRGIAAELFEFYSSLPVSFKRRLTRIIGVGNGLKKNRHLQNSLREFFKLPLHLPGTEEEAALGAAKIAAGRY